MQEKERSKEYAELVEFIAPKFDAIEQRFDKIDEKLKKLDKLEIQMGELEGKVNKLETKVDKLGVKVDNLVVKVDELPTKSYLDNRLGEEFNPTEQKLATEDKKINRLVEMLVKNKVLTDFQQLELKQYKI